MAREGRAASLPKFFAVEYRQGLLFAQRFKRSKS